MGGCKKVKETCTHSQRKLTDAITKENNHNASRDW